MRFNLNKVINYPNLPYLFLKARESLMEHFRPIMNHFGLTEQQWRVLRALDEHGQMEPREICQMCQFSSPSMAGILSRMEEVDLIKRSRIKGDQRRVLIHLSKRGTNVLSEIAPLIDLQYSYFEQSCGKQIFDDLFKVLEEFTELAKTPVNRIDLP